MQETETKVLGSPDEEPAQVRPVVHTYSFPGLGEDQEPSSKSRQSDGFRSVFGSTGLSYSAEQVEYEKNDSVWDSLADIRRAEAEQARKIRLRKEQVELDKALNSEAFKEQLAEMYQKGLEQGRQEGGQTLAQELKEQACLEGREQGYSEGFQEGRQSGIDEGASIIEHQKAFMSTLNGELKRYEQLLSSEQIQQSARLLERLLIEIVRGELKLSPEHIVNLVKQASVMMDRSDKTAVRIHVHPDDLVWLEPLKQDEDAKYLFLANKDITPGGCRVEGELGEVDAELETRIRLCIEQFRNNLLDDPEHAAEPDLSALYETDPVDRRLDQKRSEPVQASEPEPVVQKVAHHSVDTPADRVEPSENSRFSFASAADAADGLGAWASLGQ